MFLYISNPHPSQPQSTLYITTNLHIFLFLSYFFPVVAVLLLQKFSPLWVSQNVGHIARNVVFIFLGENSDIWHPETNFMHLQDSAL
jgi:hypothetical protein